MSLVVARIVERILDREDGWVDHPHDHGGATAFGITVPWLSDRLGRPATLADLQGLNREKARVLYTNWITSTGLVALCQYASDESLADCVIDWAVQTTPLKAVKLLQRAMGFTGTHVDGILGPQTLAAYDGINEPLKVLRGVLTQRLQHRARRCKEDLTQVDFLLGWINRDLSFLYL